MLAAKTDTEKPQETDENSEPSENVDEMSYYGAQLLCAVGFHVPAFRNLSHIKHLTEATKILQIKSQGCGKYELAKKKLQFPL